MGGSLTSQDVPQEGKGSRIFSPTHLKFQRRDIIQCEGKGIQVPSVLENKTRGNKKDNENEQCETVVNRQH